MREYKLDIGFVVDVILTLIGATAAVYIGSLAYIAYALHNIRYAGSTNVEAIEIMQRQNWVSSVLKEELHFATTLTATCFVIGVASLIASWLVQGQKTSLDSKNWELVWSELSLLLTVVAAFFFWASLLVRFALREFSSMGEVSDEALYESWIKAFVLLAVLMVYAAVAAVKSGDIAPAALGAWVIVGFIGYVLWHA